MGDDGIDKLTAAMAAGDEASVAAFYRRYFDWLLRQARRSCRRDEAFCLDVVQDAMLRIIRTIRRVESEPALLAWLKLVVQTTALDLLRQESRRSARELLAVSMRATSAGNIEPLSDEDPCVWLSREIARLDPELIRLIELRYENQWTLLKISQRLGLTIGKVDARLRRALKQLRKRAKTEGRFDV